MNECGPLICRLHTCIAWAGCVHMISRVIIVNQWIQTEFTIWCLTACAQSHLPQYYNVIYTLITHFFNRNRPTTAAAAAAAVAATKPRRRQRRRWARKMDEKRNNKYSHSSFMILLLLLSVIISMLPMMWFVASSLRYCCSSIHFYNIVWCAKNQYNHHNNSKYILMPQTGYESELHFAPMRHGCSVVHSFFVCQNTYGR